jgi:hypothetical protein
MRLRRTLLIVVALLAITFSAIAFGLPWRAGGCDEPAAAACAICGDGVCAKSCENKFSCPRDCGGGVSTASGQAR